MDEGVDGNLEKERGEWETQTKKYMMERQNGYRGTAMSQQM